MTSPLPPASGRRIRRRADAITRPAVALALAGLTLAAVGDAEAKGPCMRLALSEVAFGTENATRDARNQLDEYAREQATKRGWAKDAKLVKSRETVSCSVYLALPIQSEYRCLVTATFCRK